MVHRAKTKKTIWRVAISGTNWNNGTNTSVFYLNLNNSAGNRNRNISRQSVHALKTPTCGNIFRWVYLFYRGYSSAISVF